MKVLSHANTEIKSEMKSITTHPGVKLSFPYSPELVNCLAGTAGTGITANLFNKVTFVADVGYDYLTDIAPIESGKTYRIQATITGITGTNSLGFGEPKY
mgnify:CR=1 FL=1